MLKQSVQTLKTYTTTISIQESSPRRLLYSLSILHRTARALHIAGQLNFANLLIYQGEQGVNVACLRHYYPHYSLPHLERFCRYLANHGLCEVTSSSPLVFKSTPLTYALAGLPTSYLLTANEWNSCFDLYRYLETHHLQIRRWLNQPLRCQISANNTAFSWEGEPQALITDMTHWHLLARTLHCCAHDDIITLLQQYPSLVDLQKALKEKNSLVTESALALMLDILSHYQLLTVYQGIYQISPLLMFTTKDCPDNLQATLKMLDSPWWKAFAALDKALINLGDNCLSAYQLINGKTFYQHTNDWFDQGIKCMTKNDDKQIALHYQEILQHYPSIVDVGGGEGGLLKAIATLSTEKTKPSLFLYDLKYSHTNQALPQQKPYQIIGGDFLQSPAQNQLPQGKALYIIKGVLHDFTDHECRVILYHIHQAMAKDSQLLIVTRAEPQLNRWDMNAEADILMLTLFNAKERGLTEWQTLLEQTGFTLQATPTQQIEDYLLLSSHYHELTALPWVTALSLGLNATKQKGYEQALQYYDQALSSAPNATAKCEIYLACYQTYFEQSKLEAAQRMLHHAQQTQALSHLVHRAQGRLYLEVSCYETALESYHQAWQHPAANKAFIAQCWISIARVYEIQARYREAEQALQCAAASITTCYGEESAKMATLHKMSGQLKRTQQQWQLALTSFERANTIRTRLFGHNSKAVASILLEQANTYYMQAQDAGEPKYLKQALDLCHQTLDIYNEQRKLHDTRQHQNTRRKQIATNHYLRGKIYFEWQQFEDAVADFQQAQQLYQDTLSAQHEKTTEVSLWLANSYYYWAHSDTTQAQCYLEAALSQYEAIIKSDHELSQADLSLTSYAFLNHRQIVKRIAECYLKSGQIEKALTVFVDEIKHHQAHQGLLAHALVKTGLHIAQGVNSPMLSQLYYQHACLLHHEQHYDRAIRALLKAQQLNPALKKLANKLQQWQHQRADLAKKLHDRDLFIQWMRCLENWQHIQLYFLDDLERHATLSTRSQNRVTELIIKLRNCLDQAYARFVIDCIHLPNHRLDSGDNYYYPITSSKQALFNRWDEQKISAKQLSAASFELILNTQLSKLTQNPLDDLKQANYIFADGTINLNQCQAHPHKAIGLSAAWDFCWPELNTALQNHADKLTHKSQFFRMKFPGNLNLGNFYRSWVEKAISNKDKILAALVENDYIQVNPQQANAYQLTQLGHQSNTFTLTLKHGDKQLNELLSRCERLLAEKLIMVRQHLPKHSIDCYAEVESALIKHQDFAYVHLAGKKSDKTYVQQAWLQKLSDINNDSKHVRLTPQFLSQQLAERKGTLRKNKLHVYLHYLPRGEIYSWSFYEAFAQQAETQGLTIQQALKLSADIRQQLQEKNYISDRKVNHPLAQQIMQALAQQASLDDINADEENFREQLAQDLPASAQPYQQAIADLLIRRIRQRRNYADTPDAYVDVSQLMKNSLDGVCELLCKMGEARGINSNVLPEVSLTRWQEQANPITLQKNYSAVKVEFLLALKNETLTHDLLARYHRHLKAKIYALKNLNKYESAGKKALRAAAHVAKAFPWLAIHYYQTAADCYQHTLAIQQSYAAWHALAAHKASLQLWEQATISYNQAKACAQSFSERHVCAEKKRQLQHQLQQCHQQIDTDLYAQWSHAKREYYALHYLLFKLNWQADNRYLQANIQNHIVELVIKIRHLLDQAFGRFATLALYRHNNSDALQAEFPCEGSERRFQQALCQLKQKEANSALQAKIIHKHFITPSCDKVVILNAKPAGKKHLIANYLYLYLEENKLCYCLKVDKQKCLPALTTKAPLHFCENLQGIDMNELNTLYHQVSQGQEPDKAKLEEIVQNIYFNNYIYKKMGAKTTDFNEAFKKKINQDSGGLFILQWQQAQYYSWSIAGFNNAGNIKINVISVNNKAHQKLLDRLNNGQSNEAKLLTLACKHINQTRRLSLCHDYPDIYQLLLSKQPYQYANNPNSLENWWVKLYHLSNQCKHESLMLLNEQKLQEWKQTYPINNSYPIIYSENTIYSWSFRQCFPVPNHHASTELVNALNECQILKEGRVTDKTLYELVEKNRQGESITNALKAWGKQLQANVDCLKTVPDKTLQAITQILYANAERNLTRRATDGELIGIMPILEYALKDSLVIMEKLFAAIPKQEKQKTQLLSKTSLSPRHDTHSHAINAMLNQQPKTNESSATSLSTWLPRFFQPVADNANTVNHPAAQLFKHLDQDDQKRLCCVNKTTQQCTQKLISLSVKR